MKQKTHSIEYIKRQAKRIKKELKITHTEALESVAVQLGYSNWQHCLRSVNKPVASETSILTKQPELLFTDWLKRHKNRNSPLGDLASDMLRDSTWPQYNSIEKYQDYLLFKSATNGALNALKKAWKSYNIYLKRKLAEPNKTVKRNTTMKKHDLRTITYLKNISPLPFTKRQAEKFSPGDLAWISWDGTKAIPVTVMKVDDRNYSVRLERPLTKAGSVHSLFLDEVRSTPELACLNNVTF